MTGLPSASRTYRGAVREPRGRAAHELANEARPSRLAVGEKVAELFREHFNGAEISERERNAFVVVVDRLGKVDDLNAFGVGRLAVHIELEFRGGRQGVVAADGDERVDSERAESLIDGFHGRELFRIFQVGGRLERLARIRARGADADALLRAETVEDDLIEADVVLAFFKDVAFFVFDQVRVAVEHAVNFNAGARKAQSRAADNGVRRGRGPAGEENSYFFDVSIRSRRTG